MGHHFLVGDLPCGTQVLFLHGQPHHFLRPFPAGALAALPWTHSAVWRRTWTHWHRSRHLLRFRSLKISSKNLLNCPVVDLSQITATSLSVCPSPSGSLELRYHVKTRERRGSSFSQLGLEPNHTGLTAQSLFFLEESCRVKRSDTQTFSNYFKRVLKLQKTFFQLLQIKRLQLQLTNNLQNSYQISSQHQVPKTWVKQHPKTTKTQKQTKSISKLFHAQTGSIGSKLVPTWYFHKASKTLSCRWW